MYQVDPSLPFAAFVNPKIAFTQSQGIPYQYSQMLQSYPGDPLVGTTIPNTTITWNESTETQGLIFEYYQAQGEAHPGIPPFPADLQKILDANAGPLEFWNGSYEYMGFVPGVPSQMKTIYTAEVGTGRAVTAILPS